MVQYLSIEQLRKKKIALSKAIENLLGEFSKETGLIIVDEIRIWPIVNDSESVESYSVHISISIDEDYIGD